MTYFIENGVLCVLGESEEKEHRRLYIPIALREHLMHTYHRSKLFFHPGVGRMYATMKQDLYWEKMQQDIVDFIDECLCCRRSKPPQPRRQWQTMALVPMQPFAVVGTDVYGPLPESAGYRYIIVFTDHYSRWTRLVPVKGEVTANIVADALVKHWVKDFGPPQLLVADAGSVYAADITMQVGTLLGIKMHSFPAESQWRNGKTERMMRYLGERIRIWNDENNSRWHELLPFIEMSHHFTVMPQYGMSPFEILHGCKPRFSFTTKDWQMGSQPSEAFRYIDYMHDRLHATQRKFRRIDQKLAMKRLKARQKKQKQPKIKVGDSVLVFTKGTKHKFECLWSEPVQVVGKKNATTFTVLYPNRLRADVPAQRLMKFARTKDRRNQVVGPFLSTYPTLYLEGKSAGTGVPEMTLGLLPSISIPKPVVKDTEEKHYVMINAEGPVTEPQSGKLLLRYGDYVAHKVEGGGWGVSQFLAQDPDIPSSHIRLRLLGVRAADITGRTPRGYKWRYVWKAVDGERELAKGSAHHTEYPRGCEDGTPVYHTIPRADILDAVALGRDRTLLAQSWRNLHDKVDPHKLASGHKYVRKIRACGRWKPWKRVKML